MVNYMKKIYTLILITILTIITYKFISLRYINHNYYLEEYLKINNKIVYGISNPRGRILDRNGKILVDNIGINTIVYRNINKLNQNKLSNKLINIIENIEPATIIEQQNYYINHNDTNSLLTTEEINNYNNRKISEEKLKEIIINRIPLDYTDDEKKLIKIYSLLNSGYSYDNKIIKENASDKECALISELNIKDISCEYKTNRVYLYDSMNALYGTIGNISKENKDYYLEKGYSLDDQVGLSYLEKQYDDYLKGTRAK